MLTLEALVDAALALALADLAGTTRMVAFAVHQVDNDLVSTSVSALDSAAGISAGRTVVRNAAARLNGYVVIVEVLLGDGRSALRVEAGSRAEPTAAVFVQPFVRPNQPTGERRPLRPVRSARLPVDPLALAWKSANPELTSDQRTEAIHVLNHALHTPDARARSVRFARARMKYFARHMPPPVWEQQVFWDDRGQTLDDETRRQLTAAVPQASEVRFLSRAERL